MLVITMLTYCNKFSIIYCITFCHWGGEVGDSPECQKQCTLYIINFNFHIMWLISPSVSQFWTTFWYLIYIWISLQDLSLTPYHWEEPQWNSRVCSNKSRHQQPIRHSQNRHSKQVSGLLYDVSPTLFSKWTLKYVHLLFIVMISQSN